MNQSVQSQSPGLPTIGHAMVDVHPGTRSVCVAY